MNDYLDATLIDVGLDGDTLKLRLSEESRDREALPILKLELRVCRDASMVYNTLKSRLAHEVELTFSSFESEKALELSFDYNAEVELTIHFVESISAYESYSVADLTLLYDGLMRTFQARASDYHQRERRYQRILKSLRRELRKEQDHAVRKAAFFAESHRDEPHKSAEMAGEANAFSKILSVLDRLERDRD